MDETEVTNLMYNEYLSWTKAVYPPTEARYRQIYAAALPDSLVWATQLGFTETLTNTYLRHPAYANYPVVGVSWVQANDFSRSEEHTSELQSRPHLVCRLLLEKKKQI